MKLKKTGRKKKDGPIQSSVLAHELKTPLSSIKEAINLILKGVDGPVTPQQEQTLNVAKRNVDRLVRLVNNVLELGNLEGDTMSLHYEEVEMKDLVCEVSNLMEPLFRKKEIDFSIECPRDSVKMSCDGDRIKQVLINLVDNASKSFGKNDEERRTKRVCVRLNADTDRVTVEIEDNGIGIRKEDQERIFMLFSQGKVADQPRSGGIGLGLALSRYIVKKHQGTLAVKSQLGMGSRFIVTLPSVRTKSL